MFGLVKKERLEKEKRENKRLQLLVNEYSSRVLELKSNVAAINAKLVANEVGIREVKTERDILKAEVKGVKENWSSAKKEILNEVRKRLINELIELRKNARKSKLDNIGVDGKKYSKDIAHLRSFEIIRYSFIEIIAEEFVSDMEKYIYEVGEEMLGSL